MKEGEKPQKKKEALRHKQAKDNDSSSLTTTARADNHTAAGLALDDSSDSAAISGDAEAGDSLISAADNVNDGGGTSAAGAELTVGVLDSHTLIRLNTLKLYFVHQANKHKNHDFEKKQRGTTAEDGEDKPTG